MSKDETVANNATSRREKTRKPAGTKVTSGRTETSLDLSALQQTPGFMIRILQIGIFESFFDYFAPVGFSPAEHSSMITIRDNPSITQSELAAVLRIQLPNLVKVLGKLETEGLLTRTRSERDKRSVELKLTPAGAAATKQSAKLAATFNDECLAPLSAREKIQFMAMLQRLNMAQIG